MLELASLTPCRNITKIYELNTISTIPNSIIFAQLLILVNAFLRLAPVHLPLNVLELQLALVHPLPNVLVLQLAPVHPLLMPVHLILNVLELQLVPVHPLLMPVHPLLNVLVLQLVPVHSLLMPVHLILNGLVLQLALLPLLVPVLPQFFRRLATVYQLRQLR